MTDNDGLKPQTDETAQDAKTGASQADARSDWFNGLPPDAQKHIEDLRRENAKWRVEMRKSEEAARKAEEKRLTDEAKWKELADMRAQKLNEIEPKAERIMAAFEALIEGRLKRIPADIRKRAVDPIRANVDSVAFVEWLDANETMLTLQPAPNLEPGAGAQAQGKGTPDLTPKEREMAIKMGLDPAEVAKEKAKARA
jgi:hypothetical protein